MTEKCTHSALVLLILTLAVLAGCGGSDDEAAALSAEQVAAFESPYCVTAREWAVHELDGGGDGAYARGGPAGLKKWWAEQLAYLKTSLQHAPPEIRAAEALNERTIRTVLTPVLVRYGFDATRVEAEATGEEKALTRGPATPEQAEAVEARVLYQDQVCGYGGSPPAAELTFTAGAATRPYCEAAAAQQEGLDEAGLDPETLRAYFTSASFSEALDSQDAMAPSEIADDVAAGNEWLRTRRLEVLETFEYDLRRVLLESSAEESAAFTLWHPEIVEQDSRITAYQEQVCAG